MSTKVQEAFESYLQSVIPADAPVVQIVECKRSFFAGASAMLAEISSLGDDSVTDSAGVERLSALRAELRAFRDEVVRDGNPTTVVTRLSGRLARVSCGHLVAISVKQSLPTVGAFIACPTCLAKESK